MMETRRDVQIMLQIDNYISMLTTKTKPECPFKCTRAHVSTRGLKPIQSGRPQSLPPHEYLSFRKTPIHICSLNSKLCSPYANPCAMSCIYKRGNLFQLTSALTLETVFWVSFLLLLKSFLRASRCLPPFTQRKIFFH